jgi:hypothetical protein
MLFLLKYMSDIQLHCYPILGCFDSLHDLYVILAVLTQYDFSVSDLARLLGHLTLASQLV